MDRIRGKLGMRQHRSRKKRSTRWREGMVNKIAHGPIAELRKSSEDPEMIETIRTTVSIGRGRIGRLTE